jgi:hypothetical protein
MRGLRGSALSPLKPQGGAAHCRRSRALAAGPPPRPVCLDGRRGQDLLLPVRYRRRNPAVGPMDGRLGQVIMVKLVCGGRAVSFQITILKVLAGHPGGRASVTDLTRYVSILMSSGSDWTDRMRRVAARAPQLEIFADSFVLRDDRGWSITDSGRQSRLGRTRWSLRRRCLARGVRGLSRRSIVYAAAGA